jgi:hypothetical protein
LGYTLGLHLTNTLRYIHAVIKSYVEIKVARGKYKTEIGHKLDLLEMEVSSPDMPKRLGAHNNGVAAPACATFPSGQARGGTARVSSSSWRPA